MADISSLVEEARALIPALALAAHNQHDEASDDAWAIRNAIGMIDRLAAALSDAQSRTWLAFDVGCIECGEGSSPIGLFNTKEDAEAACLIAQEEQRKNWTGQHSFEVFDLSSIRALLDREQTQ